jgi:multiple antibiotic resistance protein
MGMPSFEKPVLLFLTLFALYSPAASVSSYFPIVSGLNRRDQRRLAFGLFINVTIFALIAIWIGAPLLRLLGITTDALIVTGGIVLMYAALPLMRGITEESPLEQPADGAQWRKLLFMPTTFPLTVGGTSFAILVSFGSSASDLTEGLMLSLAAFAFAAVTGITMYVSGHLERSLSRNASNLLQRIAGIILVSIAVSLLLNGVPRLVVSTLDVIRTEQKEDPDPSQILAR